jgi:hypothetical protein
MRKRIVGSTVIQGTHASLNEKWLDLEQIATVEVTSEDPHFPVEAVFGSDCAYRKLHRCSKNVDSAACICVTSPPTSPLDAVAVMLAVRFPDPWAFE